jgi:superfamily II DNA helicase RecQ
MVQRIIEELRPVDYRATGTLQRSLEVTSRDAFDGLLDAMTRLGLIEIEEAEFEKEGEVIRFRKVRLTDVGLAVRPMTPLALLISDGIVESFIGSGLSPSQRAAKTSKKKPAGKAASKATAPAELSIEGEALATRLKQWRAAEAKRLQVPVFVVMHDRTLIALAAARPRNPRELLEIDGIGPTKVERFGEQLLQLCGER